MKKTIRKILLALVSGSMLVYMMAAPLAATTYAAHRDEPIVTTKSYDMDEYLNMLASTGQWVKYEKFAKIANADSMAKHLQWYQAWVNNQSTDIANYPVAAVIANADSLGFDAYHDDFVLLSQTDSKATVKVTHYGDRYNVALERTADGYWYVDYVYQVR